MNTITKTRESEKLDNSTSLPYLLILENDDYNTFEWVIECLIKICKHDPEQASQCAHIVHFTGKCYVKRGDFETLLVMYNKLKSCGLCVSMELS